MKKYFCVETEDVCEFGDVVSLTFVKNLESGKVTVEKEVEFNENTMDLLIEMGFIEEREVEDEEVLDFEGPSCEKLDALMEDVDCLIEDFENLEHRVDDIENTITEVYNIIKAETITEENHKPKKK